MLTAEEEEDLRAALDVSADPSDWKAAAKQFFSSLRERQVRADDLLRTTFTDWGRVTVPFGKFEGQEFRAVDPLYLQWLRRWLEDDEERATTFSDLREALTNFLGPAAARRASKPSTTTPAPARRRPSGSSPR
jgi:hypothetical protein